MFSLHFSGFQNESFCTRKRPVLLDRMTHSARQNGPSCCVKWAILKIGKKNLLVLSDSFIKISAFVFVEWKKKSTRFFGMKYLQSPFSTFFCYVSSPKELCLSETRERDENTRKRMKNGLCVMKCNEKIADDPEIHILHLTLMYLQNQCLNKKTEPP